MRRRAREGAGDDQVLVQGNNQYQVTSRPSGTEDRSGEIIVADTGVGIPKRDLSRIFDRFYRLRRDIDMRRHGTGLGLAIVRSLVDEMKGQIRAFAREDRPGTRFEIQLPKVERSGDGG